MKKILASILLLVTMLCSLSSCLSSCFGDNGNDKGNNTTGPAVEGAVYSAGSKLGFLVTEDTVYSSPLYNALAKKTNVVKLTEDSTPLQNEIIIGVSNRPVSIEAYKRLNSMHLSDEQLDNPGNYTKWLIYTDGQSVAIAYDEQVDYIGMREAIDYFIENLVGDTLKVKPGIISMSVVDIYEFYLAEQSALTEIQWNNVASSVENGAEIVAAMKSLYSLYDDDLIVWMAQKG